MPHEEGGGGALNDPFGGHPLTIKDDLTMTIPEPHTMVSVGRVESSFPEHEQQLKLFTLIGVDRSEEVRNPPPPRFERGKILSVEITDGSAAVFREAISGPCTIKIFFTHR
jgi:hypothetical protein